jgi:hypothetical protein
MIMKMFPRNPLRHFSLFLLITVLAMILLPMKGSGQASEITWSRIINISNSPDFTSTDPFLLADPAGKAHLFWAEKVSNEPGNQPDTIMYAVWDGVTWSSPIDIIFSPPARGNMLTIYPHAVLDDIGQIHLFWIEQPNFPNYTLYHSYAYANEAWSAQAWSAPKVISNDLTGTKYSIHIASRPNGELHLVYARVRTGYLPPEDRAVAYIRSDDRGLFWSEPVDIWSVPDPERGASDTRMLLGDPGEVYITWTEWDGTGNGQAVYFARSLDNGDTWDRPVQLSERVGDEYERDWAQLALLGEDQLVVMWEGGYRAYRHAMYSYDGGVTWSEPIDTFPWLIGENGFVEFAYDSNGKLHLFFSQRVREGYDERGDRYGLWHSMWEGGRRWREPILSGGINPMLNPKVVIIRGNQVVATWYTSLNYEIMVMTGRIENAPELPSQPLPSATAESISAEPQLDSTLVMQPTITPTPSPTPIVLDGEMKKYSSPVNPGREVIIGILPSLLVIGLLLIIYRRSEHNR